MKPSMLFVVALVLGTGCARGLAIHGLGQTAVDVPEPPSAGSWTPPKTTLPKDIVDRTAFLLKHGMGDPGGGEYRSAKVHIGSLWPGDDKAQEIHGWVLPHGKGGPTWIVAASGLVYEAESVGSAANLDADVAQMVWHPQPNNRNRMPVMPAVYATPETVNLLLAIGRADLAQQLFKSPPPQRPGSDFLARWFDQAVTAHMRGDDRTALRVGRRILKERPAFEADALRRNGQRLVSGPTGQVVKTNEQFPHLDVLPVLIQDAERRLAEGPRPKLDIAALEALPVQAQVTELVSRLDEVSARQWGQPGGVNLIQDPIVARLVAIGPPAGEALLDAMEKDNRLTRSVSFARDFFPGRNLIRAKDAAYSALRGILEIDQVPKGPDGNPSVAMLRKFWSENKGKSSTDRWFDALANDHAGWRRWEEAVTRLFDPVGTVRQGYMSMGSGKGPAKAEALRGRANPSLADLLEKRARDITFDNDEHFPANMMLPVSLRIGVRLEEWDPKRSIPVLRELTGALLKEIASARGDSEQLLGSAVPALVARHDAGDDTAWKDYATLMASISRVPSFDSKYLKPVIDHPDDPYLLPVRRLLTTPGATFDVIGRIVKDPRVAGYDSVLISPALKLPEVRAAVLKALDDKRIIGTSWVDEQGTGWIEANGEQGQAQGTRPGPDEPLPRAGVRQPLRAADAVAHALARLRGAPKFQPFWTPAQKDGAIVKLRKFFEANRDHVDLVVGWPNNWLDPQEDRKLQGL